MNTGIRVTVWDEGFHESVYEGVKPLFPLDELPQIMERLKESEKKVFEIYPDGIGAQIVKFLSEQDGIASVHLSQFHDEQQGLTDDILNNVQICAESTQPGNMTFGHSDDDCRHLSSQGPVPHMTN